MQTTELDTTGALLGMVLAIILVVAVIGFVVVVWGMIFKRAGYSFAMALLMLVPIVNLIWLLIFAFSRWPIQKELDTYRARAPMAGVVPPRMG